MIPRPSTVLFPASVSARSSTFSFSREILALPAGAVGATSSPRPGDPPADGGGAVTAAEEAIASEIEEAMSAACAAQGDYAAKCVAPPRAGFSSSFVLFPSPSRRRVLCPPSLPSPSRLPSANMWHHAPASR